MRLDGGELFAWTVLGKVKAGRVARCGEGYIVDGCPMGALLADVTAVLVDEAEIVLAAPRPGRPGVGGADRGRGGPLHGVVPPAAGGAARRARHRRRDGR